jgi:hypothetical protein
MFLGKHIKSTKSREAASSIPGTELDRTFAGEVCVVGGGVILGHSKAGWGRGFDPHRPYQNNHDTKHLALIICSNH